MFLKTEPILREPFAVVLWTNRVISDRFRGQAGRPELTTKEWTGRPHEGEVDSPQGSVFRSISACSGHSDPLRVARCRPGGTAQPRCSLSAAILPDGPAILATPPREARTAPSTTPVNLKAPAVPKSSMTLYPALPRLSRFGINASEPTRSHSS
jgi:hypothetical protein